MDSVKPSSSPMYNDTFPLSGNFDTVSVLLNGQFSENLITCVSFGYKQTGDRHTLWLHETHFPKVSGKPVSQEDHTSCCTFCGVYLPRQLGRSSKILFIFLQTKLIISHTVLMVMERTDCFPHHNYSSFKYEYRSIES